MRILMKMQERLLKRRRVMEMMMVQMMNLVMIAALHLMMMMIMMMMIQTNVTMRNGNLEKEENLVQKLLEDQWMMIRSSGMKS